MAVATFKQASNGEGIVKALYPNAHITSGFRGPDHPLTIANPNSPHARGHGSVDVRPIPGMTFEQYVQGFKDKGYKVLQAFDEQKHPFAWTTGPNWHIVIGS